MRPPPQPQAHTGAVGWTFSALGGAGPDPGSGNQHLGGEEGTAPSGSSQHLGWIKHIVKPHCTLLRLERLLACFFITVLALAARFCCRKAAQRGRPCACALLTAPFLLEP